MPNHYIEDYEELTGRKPEPSPVDTMATGAEVEAKVVEPAKKTAAAKKTTATTKAKSK